EGAPDGDPRGEREEEVVADREAGAEHPVDVEGEVPARPGQTAVDVDAGEEGEIIEVVLGEPDAEAGPLARLAPRAHEADVTAVRLHQEQSEPGMAARHHEHGRIPCDLRSGAPRAGQRERAGQTENTKAHFHVHSDWLAPRWCEATPPRPAAAFAKYTH